MFMLTDFQVLITGYLSLTKFSLILHQIFLKFEDGINYDVVRKNSFVFTF